MSEKQLGSDWIQKEQFIKLLWKGSGLVLKNLLLILAPNSILPFRSNAEYIMRDIYISLKFQIEVGKKSPEWGKRVFIL